jgi:2-haloalkanoic acid dehalogenase type II
MRFRYLTFDCYGTLVDWRTGIENELRKALGNVRIGGQELLDAYVSAEKVQESSYKKYREVLELTASSLSANLGVQVTREAAREFASSVPRWPVFPDTKSFLHEMGMRGYRRYILSNVDNDLLEGTIRANGLEVDGFVTAEDVGSYKPNQGHWLRFMEKTGAGKSEILHCAQSLFHDIAPTQTMGIASAWVNRYGEKLDRSLGPSIICDSLASLTGALE